MHSDENILSKNYDICIVGSGPAGSVEAFQISNKYKLNVLLLELGNDLEIENPLYGIDKINNQNTVNIGRSFQYGGSTNLWSGRAAPLDLVDLAKRGWIESSGWPLSYDELSEYYEYAFKILGINDQK